VIPVPEIDEARERMPGSDVRVRFVIDRPSVKVRE
jgi:hypothetical protein